MSKSLCHKDHSGGSVEDELERDQHRGANFLVVCCIGVGAVNESWQGMRKVCNVSVSGSREEEAYGRCFRRQNKESDWMFRVGEYFRNIVNYLALRLLAVLQIISDEPCSHEMGEKGPNNILFCPLKLLQEFFLENYIGQGK